MRKTRIAILFGLLTISVVAWLIAADTVTTGYVAVTVGAGSSTPAGAALFSWTNPDGVLVTQAGVAAAQPLRQSRIFVDQDATYGTRTGVALVNPNTTPANAILILRNSSGNEIGRKSQSLTPEQHMALFVDEVFNDIPVGFTGNLTIESNQPLAAITLRLSLNGSQEPVYSTLPVADLLAPSNTSSAIFPQVAAGGGYTTQVILINRASQRVQGRLRFTGSNGSPLVLLLGNTPVSDIPYQIEANGTYRAELGGGSDVLTGYAVLTPDAGNFSPTGTVIFQYKSSNALITEAGVAASPLTTSARIFADNDKSGTGTGVAIANPGTQSVDLTLKLTDSDGRNPRVVTKKLEAGAHMASFVTQLFDNLPDPFTGLLEISSTAPVASVTLKLTINARNELVLTTLPVVDMTLPVTTPQFIFPQIAYGGGYSTQLVLISGDTTSAAGGLLNFHRPDGSSLFVSLDQAVNSQFPYQLPPAGGRQVLVGGSITAPGAALVSLLDESGNPTSELVVPEGNNVKASLRVIDSNGAVVNNIAAFFASANPGVATVDTAGNIRGVKAGFATLSIRVGNNVATGTITVVRESRGAPGFETNSVVQDLARRLYLASTQSHTILRIEDLTKVPEVYAGMKDSAGLKNALRLASQFRNPAFLAFNQAQGSLYVSDSANNVIRRVSLGSNGIVETLAGAGIRGQKNGQLGDATFNNPQGIALDDHGYLWIADSGNHTIRRIDLRKGMVETIAGKPGTPGLRDDAGESALFRSPTGIAIERESTVQQLERMQSNPPRPAPPVSVVVADTGNGVVRRVYDNGVVETIQSVPARALSEASQKFLLRSALTGPAIFESPTGIAVDAFGVIYVTEPGKGRLSAILRSGEVVSMASTGSLQSPKGLLVAEGKIVVTDGKNGARLLQYGGPQIDSITPNRVSDRGGETVTIRGSNFAPDTIALVAGIKAENVKIDGTQTITLTVPKAPSGLGTLTLLSRGGVAEQPFMIEGPAFTGLPAGYISTFAGGSTYAGDGAKALSARVTSRGVAVDSSGNIYVSDYENHRIRRVDALTGIITTVAGTGQAGSEGDEGQAIAAKLFGPTAIALDQAGNLYIAESSASRVRKVAPSGVITTVAGNGYSAPRIGDGGPATKAELWGPSGLALDANGNLYIADTFHHVIRKVEPSGIISTVAGNWEEGYPEDDGPATSASLRYPNSVAIDPAGNLLIVDSNGVHQLEGNIIKTVAWISGAKGVVTDASGNIFVASEDAIEQIDKIGEITTVAGRGSLSGPAGNNGQASAAKLSTVEGIAIDAAGNLYIAESGDNWVRKVDAVTKTIAPVAGNGLPRPSGDGLSAMAVTLTYPHQVAIDPDGNIVIVDDFYVRKVGATNIVASLIGDGTSRSTEANKPAKGNPLNKPYGVAWDAGRNMYITSGNSVLKIDAATSLVSRISDGLGSPHGLAFDSVGNLYIADRGMNHVRKVAAATGVETIYAGGGDCPGSSSGDGCPATSARLNRPTGLAFDRAGNLYISQGVGYNGIDDDRDNRIRKVDSHTGIITTVAGGGLLPLGSVDVPATEVALNGPTGLTFDAAGNLFFTEIDGQRLRKVSTETGKIKTLAGCCEVLGYGGDNGPAAGATLASPSGLAFDGAGNLFIADSRNHRIRVIKGPIDAAAPTDGVMTITCNPTAGPATVGVAYTTSCIASGGVPPYSFGLNPLNVIPAGLTAVQSGANVATISGTPIQAGNYSFGIFVQDSATPRHSATTTFTGTVAPAGGPITLKCNPGTGPATVGEAYATFCFASGGVPPYSFGLNPPNVIPAGLTLGQSYINEVTISGTPTQAGNYSFGLFVQDSANPRQLVTTTFTGTIAPASLPNYIRLAGQVPDPSLGCKDSAANCISIYLPTQGLGHVKIQH